MPRKKASKKRKSTKAKKTKPNKRVKRSSTKKSKRSKKSKSRKIAATPTGYHSITPYLIVRNASNAIDFYQKAFGAKLVMRINAADGKVGHAELRIGDAKFMLADEYPGMDHRSPESYGGSPMSIYLYVNNADQTVDRAINAGARVIKPVEDMFWGDRSGTLEDPFGHKWYVSTHVENVSSKEIKKRANAMFGKSI